MWTYANIFNLCICKYVQMYINICKYMQICTYMQTCAKYMQIYKYMQTYANYMYAIICKYMQTYANICKYMHIYASTCSVSEFQFSGIIWAVRISNSEFAEELFGGVEFRITDSRARFICRLFVFRINLERNYDRTFSLFQGVRIVESKKG